MGHKDPRLGQIVYILVFHNIHLLGFLYRMVSNLFFRCVTVKTIYSLGHWERREHYEMGIRHLHCSMEIFFFVR